MARPPTIPLGSLGEAGIFHDLNAWNRINWACAARLGHKHLSLVAISHPTSSVSKLLFTVVFQRDFFRILNQQLLRIIFRQSLKAR